MSQYYDIISKKKAAFWQYAQNGRDPNLEIGLRHQNLGDHKEEV